MLSSILSRLAEPSTYAGFSAIALGFGVSQPLYTSISLIVAGVCGVAAVVLGEKKAA